MQPALWKHCMQVELLSKMLFFFMIILFRHLPQLNTSRFTVIPGNKMASIKLGFTSLASHLTFLRVLRRQSRSSGASIECNFTAEVRDLFIFFTTNRESWRLKLGYLILTLVKPWKEAAAEFWTVRCGFNWFLALILFRPHIPIFHMNLLQSVFGAFVRLCQIEKRNKANHHTLKMNSFRLLIQGLGQIKKQYRMNVLTIFSTVVLGNASKFYLNFDQSQSSFWGYIHQIYKLFFGSESKEQWKISVF